MIFVDTNVFIYAVGRPHPLRSLSRDFFNEAVLNSQPLCTSAEVLRELMHAYFPVGRTEAIADALSLIRRSGVEVWPLEEGDVELARELSEQHPTLGARGLCHLASCWRRGVREIMTLDEGLGAVALEVRGSY